LKRLAQPTGQISDQKVNQDDSNDKIVRPAILVHSGPNGDKVTFLSGDGEISFDEERIKNIVKNQNEKLTKLAEGYGGVDKMPSGAFPPILDQHENDSNNRISGRLASALRFEKRNVPGVGENVACAMADITFLGEDNVKKVKDGRIYHLSIGIDESTDTLSEVSTVITPAAPGAMLLSKNKINKGDKIMSQKKLNAHKSKMAKLSSVKESISKLVGKVSEANATLKLTKKQGEITSRLTGLVRSAKLTPAEFKKIDIKKLSALTEESLNTVLSTFEAMEPKIMAGQMGSSDATPVMDMVNGMKKTDIKRLKSEIKKDMARASGKKLEAGEEEEQNKDHGFGHQMASDKVGEQHASPKEGGLEEHIKTHLGHLAIHKEHLAKMKSHLEAGEHDAAKEHHKVMEAHHLSMEEHAKKLGCHGEKHMEMGDVKSEDYKKSNEELQKQVDELNTQMARIAGMVDELMTVEKEEGHQLEADVSEEEKIKKELEAQVSSEKEEDKPKA